MSISYMPFYPADYLADTMHLTTMEHGAYTLLLWHYWCKGGLPTDDVTLAKIVKMTTRQWMRVRPTISKFFTADWRHKRVDAELAESQERIEGARRAGLASGRSRKLRVDARKHNNAGRWDLCERLPTESVKPLEDKEQAPTNVERESNISSTISEGEKIYSRFVSNETNLEGLSPRSEGVVEAKPSVTPEAVFYRRGREILGAKAGAILTKVKLAYGGNFIEARQFLELAATKGEPMAYICASLRKAPASASDHPDLPPDVPLYVGGNINPVAMKILFPDRYKPQTTSQPDNGFSVRVQGVAAKAKTLANAH